MTDTTAEAVSENDSGILDSVFNQPEPEAQEEPKAEAKPEEVKEEAKESDAPKEHTKVSHAALHEERERRKEESARRLEAERQLRELKETILRNQKPEQEQEEDPLAKIDRLDRENKERAKISEEEHSRKVEFTNFINRYRGSAEAFSKDNPDFDDAYKYVLESRKRELSVFIKDPIKLAQRLQEDEYNIAAEAYANEENPAKIIFEIARERGFKAGHKQENRIEQLDKGLKASKSLGSGGSKPDVSGLNLDGLSRMDDAEFDKVWSEYEKRSKR